MSMQIHYTEIKNLPRLAWLAEIKDGNVDIIHGTWVETFKNWFVEGAWSGDFAKGKFGESDWFCGTGAMVINDRIVFSTPTHVTNGLFIQNIPGGGV